MAPVLNAKTDPLRYPLMAAMKWLDNRVRQVCGLFQAGQGQPTVRGEWSPPPKFVLDGIGVCRGTLDAAAALASDACSPGGWTAPRWHLFWLR
eukprot:7244073-Pyramimonas_sp.AAC.1